MNFENRLTVPASIDEAWALLMDVPAVGRCVPGLEPLESLGEDKYKGRMTVKVGAIRVTLAGDIHVVERDSAQRLARLEARGSDKRVGGAVHAKVDLRLRELLPRQVEMTVTTDAAVMGKLGELGQAVMTRKADQVMKEFAQNLAAQLDPSLASGEPRAPAQSAHGEETRVGVWRRFMAWLRTRRERSAE
jgi:carbon monoxide dehydrogenase subunit G